ncbi:GFA family protein, partial [Bradyrhizobium sp.]|uniref:GFA family protein n=1 Tax=Bradyrhizobium sp. TaxID=376 RepID=UPI0025BAB999
MGAGITLSGGCHCGAVRFEADVGPQVTLLDCNCSMCARSGYLHLIVGGADFRLVAGGDALTEYRFGTGAARHLFCKVCGIKSFYKPRSHPDGWSLNWRCLDSDGG